MKWKDGTAISMWQKGRHKQLKNFQKCIKFSECAYHFLNLTFHNLHIINFSAVFGLFSRQSLEKSLRMCINRSFLAKRACSKFHFRVTITMNCYSEKIRAIFFVLIHLSSKLEGCNSGSPTIQGQLPIKILNYEHLPGNIPSQYSVPF